MRTMRIAILGGLGFVGKKLTTFLSSINHDVTVVVVDKPSNLQSDLKCFSLLEFYDPINQTAKSFDVVINLAAKRSTTSKPIPPAELRKFNFVIPRDFIRHASHPGTLVLNASTYIQNFDGIEGHPADVYAATKQELSNFLSIESQSLGIKTLDFFLFTVYGPGDKEGRLIPTLISSIKNREVLKISAGHQLLNLIHVDDVVANLARTINGVDIPSYSKAFLWEEEYFTVRNLVHRIEKISGTTIECEWGARPYVGHEMFDIWSVPMPQFPELHCSIDLETGLKCLLAR